ncbi:MAG: hypothetical protein RL261_2199 [Pseudomonadota bacterium]|jgi:hypothetical protein
MGLRRDVHVADGPGPRLWNPGAFAPESSFLRFGLALFGSFDTPPALLSL